MNRNEQRESGQSYRAPAILGLHWADNIIEFAWRNDRRRERFYQRLEAAKRGERPGLELW